MQAVARGRSGAECGAASLAFDAIGADGIVRRGAGAGGCGPVICLEPLAMPCK
ncbi:hypothetical protein LG3211_4693 [Lysobacter gummosus]|nr:hypothetical protein LG3211_4693 [Lysobacter gummosus]